jgi:hypothetical protein
VCRAHGLTAAGPIRFTSPDGTLLVRRDTHGWLTLAHTRPGRPNVFAWQLRLCRAPLGLIGPLLAAARRHAGDRPHRRRWLREALTGAGFTPTRPEPDLTVYRHPRTPTAVSIIAGTSQVVLATATTDPTTTVVISVGVPAGVVSTLLTLTSL